MLLNVPKTSRWLFYGLQSLFILSLSPAGQFRPIPKVLHITVGFKTELPYSQQTITS